MKTILLGVDSGGLAESVVPAVAAVARAENAEVVALHVTDAREPNEAWRNATSVLERVVMRLAQDGVRAEARLREGSRSEIADQIVGAAAELGAAVIALGSHGRSDLGALFLGSIGHRVAELTSVPVLIAREGAAANRPSLRRVMVAIDASSQTGPAVDLALELALATRAEVRLVHALVNVVVDGSAYLEPKSEAAALAGRWAAVLRDPGIKVSTRILDGWGSVASRIVDAAAAWDADMVIVGSRRLGDLAGLLQSSTSHAVAAQTDRPLVIAGRPVGPGA